MVQKKKILIFAVPFYGHVNPMTGMIYELVNKNTYEVIFYGSEEMRTLIEKTGAEFRLYSYFPMQKFKRKPTNIKQDSAVIHTLLELMDISSCLVPDLVRIVECEKPDLIVYDMWALHTKYLLKILKRNYEKKLTKSAPPASVLFTPFFAWKENVYPNKKEFRMMVQFDFKYLFKLAVLFYKQMYLNWQFGLFIFNPLRLFFQPSDKINIVPIFYELQPRVEQFDKTFHFVGCCISEQVRSMHIDNEKFRLFMSESPAINPIGNFNQIKEYESQPKLIYVSLGTIFNNNFSIFDIIIEAIRKLGDENTDQSKSSRFRAIFSVGSEVYDLYERKIKHENYQLPENIILLSSAPQIEILKRASLFITHAGMNSIAESIHYSVPVICIPIQVDQPLVALRVSDELRLGKQFHYDRLNSDELKEAIWEILNNKRYLENMIIYSDISRRNHGSHKSAQIVDDLMKKVL